jgi:hypothetical protein
MICDIIRGDDVAAQHAQQGGEPCSRAVLRDEVAVALDPEILGQQRRMLDAKGRGDADRARWIAGIRGGCVVAQDREQMVEPLRAESPPTRRLEPGRSARHERRWRKTDWPSGVECRPA